MPNSNPGILRNIRFKRVDLVDMGANFDPKTNDGAHIMLFKRAEVAKDGPGLASVHVDSPDWDADDADDYEKATLDAAARRALPDSDYAAVWTDAKGKKHRKLPIHDAGHLAAARGRVNAEGKLHPDIPPDVLAAAKRKIDAASNKEKSMVKTTVGKLLKSLLGMAKETDPEKRKAAVDAFAKDLDLNEETQKALNTMASSDGAPPAPHPAKVAHDNLVSQIASHGAGPFPDGHPVHALKAMHKAMHEGAGQELAGAGVECPGEGEGSGTGDDDMTKMGSEAVPAAVAKRMTAFEKENADLRKQLTSEIEKRATDEMRAILTGFKKTAFNLDTDVALYMAMKRDNPTLWDRTLAIFKATEGLLADSVLFKDLGTRAGIGEGSESEKAWAQLVAQADSMMEKSADGKLTHEQALEKVMLMPKNNKLVKQYRQGVS